MKIFRSLLRSSHGAVELTIANLFMMALTLGLGMGRGIEADLQFLTEDLAAQSNFAASRLAAGHAHSANAIADNNILSVGSMAPLLAVQADNIVMDLNGAVYCGNSATPGIAPAAAALCAEYTANKPRALAKLAYLKGQQTSLWGSLEHLSGAMDKVAGFHGQEVINSTIAGIDPKSRVSYDDPTNSKETWSGRNAFTGCSLASKDALASTMPGEAFPQLLPNLFVGLPQAITAGLPALCPSTGPGTTMPKLPQLPEIPEVQQAADKECNDSQSHMRDQLDASKKAKTAKDDGGSVEDEGDPTFSSDVDAVVKCEPMQAMGKGAAKQVGGKGGAVVIRRGRELYACTFDHDQCKVKAVQKATADFLKKMGLPSIPSFGPLGGSTRSPGSANPSLSSDFCAGTSVSRAVDQTTAQIGENITKLMSFGQVNAPTGLRNDVSRSASGSWYFPSGRGPYTVVPPDQRGFVSAWRHSLSLCK